MKMEELKLTQEWDKTFAQSDKVDHCKVTFTNRYGITLAADLYVPKDRDGKLLSERTISNKTELAKALLEEFGVKYDI